MLKHNTYFEGKVQSIGFTRNGRNITAGVINVGEFRFNTGAAERMTVVSGELSVKQADGEAWVTYPAGTAFEVPEKSYFDVKASAPAAYVCEFL